MPAYSFEAIDAQGQPRKGVLEADTARAARGLLRAQSLIPLNISPVAGEHKPGAGGLQRLFGGRVFSNTGLAVWTRQLSGLMSAGCWEGVC